MIRNIKLTLEYDGTDYCGWQKQKDLPTIQAYLERCIFQLTGEEVAVYGASRTDSGVHAYGQVANFHTESKISAEVFAKALNAYLPEDIVITESSEVAPEFHAQFCARAKAYSYHIICRPVRPAIESRYAHWVMHPLSVERMRKAANFLIGTHDFSSFEAANSPRNCNVRTVNYIDISQKNCYIKISVEADGFLYRMVRNIVGTFIAVARDQMEVEAVCSILKAKDRTLAAATAPAKGLFLQYVVY